MTPFTFGEVGRIRIARRAGGRFSLVCAAFAAVHTREEIVEAWDATIRFERDYDALRWVNHVLAYQDAGLPLINGRPASTSSAAFNGWGFGASGRPRPMF